MAPKVSVIIPNYNHAQYLKLRIDSVLAQTFQDFEIILLDDCSTDESKQVIETYRGNKKISNIIYNEANSGSTFKQWEKGIALAKGEYIWIAESDDWAEEFFLERLVSVMLEEPEIGITYCDSMEVDSDGAHFGKWSRWQEHFATNIWNNHFTKTGLELNVHYHSLYNVIPNASSAVFKKELYNDSIFKEKVTSLKYVGDWYIWFSIFMVTKVHYHHNTLNYFRSHGATTRSLNNTNVKKVMEYYNAIYIFKKLTAIKYTKIELEKRLSEVFEMWRLGVRALLTFEVFLSLIKIYRVDKHIFNRIYRYILLPKLNK
jgi:glycosyltransferase involved in cell wall biosynthesis